jgi:hypothetical protein
MITAVVLAAIMAEDALARLETLPEGLSRRNLVREHRRILGYFDIAGLGDIFSLYGRASGTFKDPNVLGPFLVLPIAFAIQHILIGRCGLLRGLLSISVPLVQRCS